MGRRSTKLGDESGSAAAAARGGICVLGMHRSGTSLAAGVLHHLGVYLGDETELRGPDGANPRGYWELPEIVALNDELLDALGVAGDPAALPPGGWEQWVDLDRLRDSARALIEERFGGMTTWGWKDPRTSITLPFWAPLVDQARYVVCVRNPVDVAQSLRSIAGDGPALDPYVSDWVRHTTLALEHTSGCPRLVVDYDAFLTEPEPTVRRLARFTGLEERADDARIRRLLESFIDPTLALFRTPAEAALTDQRASREAVALYRELRRLSSPDSATALEPEALAAEWQSVERLARQLRPREASPPGAGALDAISGASADRVAELEDQLSSSEGELRERDASLAAAGERATAREQAAGQSERTLAALRDQRGELESRLAAAEAERDELGERTSELARRLDEAGSSAAGLQGELARERSRAEELAAELDSGRAGREQLERTRGELEQAVAERERLAQESDRAAQHQRSLVEERDELVRQLEARIAELQQVAARELEHVADRDQRLVGTQTEIAELLGHTERLKAAIEERDERLATLKRFLQEQSDDYHFRDSQQQQLLLAMRRSRSWRMTRPWRRIAILLRAMIGRGDSKLKP